jgi:hypothetical protein
MGGEVRMAGIAPLASRVIAEKDLYRSIASVTILFFWMM